jgi:hypothetical protein
MLADSWPEKYSIEIESSPYYGRGDGYFHPSTHALMDERLLFFIFHPETRDKMRWPRRDLSSQLTLAMGKSLHGVVQTQFQMAGLCGPDDIEVEYINRKHHVRGRADFLVHHPNGGDYLVEMKTQNARQFYRQETLKPEWDAQLSIALDTMGYEMGILLLVEAGYPFRMKELRVPRNDELLSQVYSKFDRVRQAIDLDLLPKPCCEINSKMMQSCPARFSCWLKGEE